MPIKDINKQKENQNMSLRKIIRKYLKNPHIGTPEGVRIGTL